MVIIRYFIVYLEVIWRWPTAVVRSADYSRPISRLESADWSTAVVLGYINYFNVIRSNVYCIRLV